LERKKNEPITHHVPSASAIVNSSQTTTPTGSYQDLTTTGGTASRGDRLARKRSKSRSTQGDFRIQLTLEQKLDIVTLEYDQMKIDKSRREIADEKNTDQFEVCFYFLFTKSIVSSSLISNGSMVKSKILN
jgi:N-acyl-D-aspartate/D-glutamate deacylase